jgi:hypothetical protein
VTSLTPPYLRYDLTPIPEAALTFARRGAAGCATITDVRWRVTPRISAISVRQTI